MIDEEQLATVHHAERENAAATARSDTPERARRQMLRRHDGLVAHVEKAAPGRIACRAGCAFCCYLRVVASPVEVFGLLAYLERTLSSEAFAAFRARTQTRAEQVTRMTHDEQIHTNMVCPVLVGSRCSGYSARPLRCRNYHSLDRASCEDMFAHPEKDDPSPVDGELKLFGEAMLMGFEAGMADATYDGQPYELSTALHEAMTDPNARQRFHRGERAFLVAQPGADTGEID